MSPMTRKGLSWGLFSLNDLPGLLQLLEPAAVKGLPAGLPGMACQNLVTLLKKPVPVPWEIACQVERIRRMV